MDNVGHYHSDNNPEPIDESDEPGCLVVTMTLFGVPIEWCGKPPVRRVNLQGHTNVPICKGHSRILAEAN